MTLATLKGMNFNVGDVANAFKIKAADSMFSGVPKAPEKAASPSKTFAELTAETAAAAQKTRDAAKPAAPVPEPEEAGAEAAPGLVDPIQLWGALTQQFQQIAANAMKDTGANAAMDATKNMATGFAKDAVEATKKVVATVVKSSTPVKAAAKPADKSAAKAPAKKAAAKTTGRAS